MTDYTENITPTQDPAASMRHAYRRCGLAFLTTMLFLALFIPFLFYFLRRSEANGIPALTFFKKYLFFFNELLTALALFAGALFLYRVPVSPPVRKRTSFKLFVLLFTVSIAFATVGSYVGEFWASLWYSVSGISTQNALNTAMTYTSLWQTILCAGIITPIIEEYFFRKLLIDRLRGYSETLAILTSAIFFAFFHQNIYQFFYTLAFGLVLAYLYVRTGSYLAVTLLHMAFNFFLGIFPLLFSEAISLFTAVIETNPSTLQIVQYFSLTFLSFLYTAAYIAANILGVIFFFIYAKKIRICKSECDLSPETKLRATLLNFGMIAAISISLLTLAQSLLS